MGGGSGVGGFEEDTLSPHPLQQTEEAFLEGVLGEEVAEGREVAYHRALDSDGDGMIDFSEFSGVMAAEGDDMRKGTSGVLREREQKRLEAMPTTKGRFGATPSFSYGVQARELLQAGPNSAYYATPAERLQQKPLMARCKYPIVEPAATGRRGRSAPPRPRT